MLFGSLDTTQITFTEAVLGDTFILQLVPLTLPEVASSSKGVAGFFSNGILLLETPGLDLHFEGDEDDFFF